MARLIFSGDYWRSADGQKVALRCGAVFYAGNAILVLSTDGWRAVSWVGWLLLAAGFVAQAAVVRRQMATGGSPVSRAPFRMAGYGFILLGVTVLCANSARLLFSRTH